MSLFDILKRWVGSGGEGHRRRDDRVRAALGARILVVDDSATIRAMLGKLLSQDGYEVIKAADAESAIETAHADPPDLIFLDIVLPGMSGFAALRALRRDSSTCTTPIVMMSGNPQATEQFYVQRFGADGFIKKPFGRAEVFHSIRSLVEAGRMAPRVPVTPAGVTAAPDADAPRVAQPAASVVTAGGTNPAVPGGLDGSPPVAPDPLAALKPPPVPAAHFAVAAPAGARATPEPGATGSWALPARSLAMHASVGAELASARPDAVRSTRWQAGAAAPTDAAGIADPESSTPVGGDGPA